MNAPNRDLHNLDKSLEITYVKIWGGGCKFHKNKSPTKKVSAFWQVGLGQAGADVWPRLKEGVKYM